MTKLSGSSHNYQEELLQLLQDKFPEVFTEGKVDPKKLKATLGESVNDSNERYGLNWAGKSDCFRHIQEPVTATLKPCRKESVDFDKTENLFIEGDNLEVLKVMQKSYYGKVKMIYIDPPYNTGSDSFIYPDKFEESKEEYLERVGEKEEGQLMKDGMFQQNSKENGHYHSNWLSMMYPRLFLAHNLMRDDGVIFVSIDDNEVHNLRMVMNEVFGEENFMGSIIWKKKTNGNNMGNIPPVHDYILAYSKHSNDNLLLGFPLSEDYIKKNYSNPDNDPKGPWTTSDLSANHKGPHFPIVNPKNGESHLPPSGRYWVFNEKEVEKRINDGRIIFGKGGEGKPVQKVFLSQRKSNRKKAESWWDNHGLNSDGTTEMAELIGAKIFVHPKPSKLIKNVANIATTGDDIVLDFFSGSGTTAHAVMALNAEDGGNRKCISVQLPELCDEKSEAYKAGYKTIADIAKERIRRAGKKIQEESKSKNLDTGFKVFKLEESNFKIWRGNVDTEEALQAQLEMFVDNVKKESTQENILYELVLKSGLDINTAVEKKEVEGKAYFVLGEGELIICLEDDLTQPLIDAVLSAKPEKIVVLDKGFQNDDQLKTNTLLQAEDEGVEFKVI